MSTLSAQQLDNIRMWVTALRSGEHKQVRGIWGASEGGVCAVTLYHKLKGCVYVRQLCSYSQLFFQETGLDPSIIMQLNDIGATFRQIANTVVADLRVDGYDLEANPEDVACPDDAKEPAPISSAALAQLRASAPDDAANVPVAAQDAHLNYVTAPIL